MENQVAKVIHREREGIPRVYANQIQFAKTPFDLRLTFGEIIEVSEDTILIEDRAVITLGWAKVKNLAEFLQKKVEEFESLNGPISEAKLAPDVAHINDSIGPIVQ